jgi:hypothetical protein
VTESDKVITAQYELQLHSWRTSWRWWKAYWDQVQRLPTKKFRGPGCWINLDKRHLSGGLNIARNGSMPVEMHSLEHPIPTPVLSARKSNGSQASERYELSLRPPQIAGTVLPW